MKTKIDVYYLLLKYKTSKRDYSCNIISGGALQCSVGFISSFPDQNDDVLDTFYKGFVSTGLFLKEEWPAIWLFTLTQSQLKEQHAQDLIVGLNAVELYNYLHKGHGNRISLYMADPEYFNYDFIYDICEEQLKERNK